MNILKKFIALSFSLLLLILVACNKVPSDNNDFTTTQSTLSSAQNTLPVDTTTAPSSELTTQPVLTTKNNSVSLSTTDGNVYHTMPTVYAPGLPRTEPYDLDYDFFMNVSKENLKREDEYDDKLPEKFIEYYDGLHNTYAFDDGELCVFCRDLLIKDYPSNSYISVERAQKQYLECRKNSKKSTNNKPSCLP